MTIDEAIEILSELGEGTVEQIYNQREDAIKLGIEALQAWKLLRENPGISFDSELPGETMPKSFPSDSPLGKPGISNGGKI